MKRGVLVPEKTDTASAHPYLSDCPMVSQRPIGVGSSINILQVDGINLGAGKLSMMTRGVEMNMREPRSKFHAAKPRAVLRYSQGSARWICRFRRSSPSFTIHVGCAR